MSRLGDLLRTERLRRKMTLKQVAKLGGVSESYLKDVEEGKRIIADDQARRILKKIGLKEHNEEGFTLDDIAATVDLQTVTPKPAPVPVKEKKAQPESETVYASDAPVTGGIWLDALTSVMKRVPVYNAVMKEVGHRLLPVENGKIEGASPEKVFYFMAPDDDMRGFRVTRGDVVLVVPAAAPVDGAMMLIQTPQGRVLRVIKRLDNFKVLLQRYDAACESEIMTVDELHIVGRCVRLEAEL